MTESPIVQAPALRAHVDGDVYASGDQGWDVARGAWNLAVDQHPALVAIPASVADVQALVRAAREAGMGISVQGTGHNAAAYDGSLAGRMLIKTTRLAGVDIDGAARRARVGAGALWGDLVGAAAGHGLAALQGSSHDVGVAGYALGGGVSLLGRKHGLASEKLTEVEVVTADGILRRVDAEVEADLFWALRGGGGNFGVVTAVETELIELGGLSAGALFFPFERSAEVLHAWREWTGTVPEEMTSVGRMMQFPPLEQIPEPLRGNAFAVVEAIWLGEPDAGDELLRPLRELGPSMDTVAPTDTRGLLEVHMDPPEPVPGLGDHMMLGGLDEASVDALVEAAGPGSGSPLLSVELRHVGGALARRPEGAGALGALDGEFMTFAVAMLPDPALAPPVREAFTRIRAALAGVDTGGNYLNFAEAPVAADSIYRADSLSRLRAIKAEIDPDGMFRGNHPLGG
jgi:FAD/FMN-containing dehydrogenase